MRLIDADAEIKKINAEIDVYVAKLERLKARCSREPHNSYHNWSNEIKQAERNITDAKNEIKVLTSYTTAYDVDKVVEILDKEAHMLYSLQALEPVKAWRNEYLITIVKAGGSVSLMDIVKGAVKDE